jgi:hypothetical protein
VRVELRDRDLLAALATGRIAARRAYVEGRVDFVGSLRELMAMAGGLAGDPLQGSRAVSPLRRAGRPGGLAAATPARYRRANVQSHYDVSTTSTHCGSIRAASTPAPISRGPT